MTETNTRVSRVDEIASAVLKSMLRAGRKHKASNPELMAAMARAVTMLLTGVDRREIGALVIFFTERMISDMAEVMNVDLPSLVEDFNDGERRILPPLATRH